MRYQIVYTKNGDYALTTWKDSEAAARDLADKLRSSGYNVQVWEHGKDTFRMIYPPQKDLLSGIPAAWAPVHLDAAVEQAKARADDYNAEHSQARAYQHERQQDAAICAK